MDSNYRAERAEEQAEAREKARKEKARKYTNVIIFQLFETRMDPDSASGLGQKVAKYL